MEKNSTVSGIVLLAKKSGITSFSSLYSVKKSLNTSKVGHTGTLDSFAQGLLVVCVGKLTRLASHITAFNKSYEAVIEFGKETDTLDPTGNVIKTSRLPLLSELKDALKKFSGTIDQVPPVFSALHVDGQRASDLMRKGKEVKLKSRPVTVFDYEILEVKLEDEKVKYARIRFDVSKGTYIRSLARDIGKECNSCAYLTGLLRTKVGCFELKDASGFFLLKDFTIDSVLNEIKSKVYSEVNDRNEDDKILNEEIREKIKVMTRETSEYCGLTPVTILLKHENDFYNGRFLKKDFFSEFKEADKLAVFTENDAFAGVVSCKNGKIIYEYVLSCE
ncbi:MAG: tRNA pseudouridine(55) synthase TruB [Treponema sp.]|nr:tRNA pseudouridine(55) synthase TruB [Treponema sp.]